MEGTGYLSRAEPSCDPALPILTLQNTATLETRRVCDMGRGGNGVWADVAKFRVPPLRGLAARALIRYYEKRFDMRLSHRQRDDLEASLGAL